MVLLFDVYNLPENVYEVVFATEQQVIVGKMLIEEMKQHGGSLGKTEMSIFANRLHDGTTVQKDSTHEFIKKKEEMKISYNKRQFYDRILTPMKSMGLIDYDLYKKQYKISDRFNKAMISIGLLWLREMQKPSSR